VVTIWIKKGRIYRLSEKNIKNELKLSLFMNKAKG
jgi:hypothetical protein